jgi:putative drug exporter of the RND superfamily
MAHVGRFCFRYRWWVLIGWLAAMVAGVLAAGPVFERMGNTQPQGLESVQASEVLSDGSDRGDEVVALLEGVDPQASVTRDAVARAVTDAGNITGVKAVDAPVTATDGKGVAVAVTLAKLEDPAEDETVQQVSERLRRLADDVPGSTVRIGGDAVLDRETDEAVQADLGRAEVRPLPLIAIVLVLVFGGIVAAGVPLLATVATVTGALAVLLGFSTFVDLDSDVVTVVTLFGLGLSIDYGLLLVARYREELAAGHDRAEAIDRTWSTAGRTIMFSALTVTAALTGLLLLRVSWLQALGAAGISTALVAMLAAITLTSALLGVFGRWIRPSKRAVARHAVAAAAATHQDGADRDAAGETDRGFFARLAQLTQRRPLLVASGVAAVLLAAGAPLLTATIRQPQLDGLPRSLESVQVADDLTNRYGQTAEPAVTVVARTDPASLDAWAARWRIDPEVARVEAARAAGPNLATVVLAVRGDSQGDPARALVRRVRADRPAGVESWVTGDAAVLGDLLARLGANLPWAIAVTMIAMLLLLFLMTGSMVVPLKAIVMNVISLGATFGVLVAVFEHGWLSGPLDTLTVGGLSPFVVVIVFAFAFGLSMDYEVFLLGRIKEYVDAGQDTDAAVRHGLQRSGRIITSAALLMLIVFGFFAAAKVGDIEQVGLGLFVAVLVDATIVRCVLVPASMTLLGRWNWWAPGPLKRLHDRYGLHEHQAAPARELVGADK